MGGVLLWEGAVHFFYRSAWAYFIFPAGIQMALKLRLRPHEKAILNGVVIENGGRATDILVHNFAHILRDPDVMQEEQADTPSKRCYFAAQLMLIDPANAQQYRAVFDGFLNDLKGAFINPDILARLDEADQSVTEGNYYKALRTLKDVIAYEEPLLTPSGRQDEGENRRDDQGA